MGIISPANNCITQLFYHLHENNLKLFPRKKNKKMTPKVSESQRSLQSSGDSSDSPERCCGMWARRSKLEKGLLAVTVILVLLSVGLATPLAIIASSTNAHSKETNTNKEPINENLYDMKVCITPGCVKIAAVFLESGNRTADPCEDFFQYTCGQYEQKSIIADHETSMTRFREVDDSLNARLRTILEEPKGKDEAPVFQKVKDMYAACMNTTIINEKGAQPLHDLLKIIGGWPVLEGEKWDKSQFDWKKALVTFRNEGLSNDYIVEVSVSVDGFNATSHIIEVDQPSLGMPSRNYLLKGINDSLVGHYFKLMTSVAEKLGANKTKAEEELRESLLLEIQIANFTQPMEERRNYTKLYSKKTLRALAEEVPNIEWPSWAGEMIAENLTDAEVVEVTTPSVLNNIVKLIDATDKRVVANYIVWRVVMSTIQMLDKDFRALSVAYAAALTGQSVDSPRWEICLTTVRSTFGNAVGALYVKNFFEQKARDQALEMVKDIREEFKNLVNDVDWMDDITRKRALKKAEVMDQMIAYPQEILNETILGEHYKNVTVDEEDYFGSVLASRRYWTTYKAKQLRKPFKRTSWEDLGSVAVVNAYFNGLRNLIMFPAGILQGIFFSADRPKYVNYASIGFVIGHEITHGFDDQGRQFDQNGNLRLWWEPKTDQLFKERAQCIIHQYGNYTLPRTTVKLNGINTQGENIADNGGVKEAYRAYAKWVEKNGHEEKLPGLNQNVKQLFWISYANVWCAKTRPEAAALQVMTGAHSPQRFRVNGVVSNSDDFAKDFNCPVGSPMNPAKKCTVW